MMTSLWELGEIWIRIFILIAVRGRSGGDASSARLGRRVVTTMQDPKCIDGEGIARASTRVIFFDVPLM